MSSPAHSLWPMPQQVRVLRRMIEHHLVFTLGKRLGEVSASDLMHALSLVTRERLIARLTETMARQREAGGKQLAYLSMEFLVGRSLDNNLINLGLRDVAAAALAELGADLDALREEEADPALGNGGLGRLAACFLDSLATLDLPATGYGIHYEHGLFRQEIDRGRQRERPDSWNPSRSPWLLERPDEAVLVPLYGTVRHEVDANGGYNPMWMDWKLVIGVPYDFPIVGFGGHTVNALRLFSARGSNELDMQIFSGDDHLPAGRELRLVQEYFLVACAVRDVVRRYSASHAGFDALPDKVALQLNDTPLALAVAELMRLLVDEQGIAWDRAWELTRSTCGYTNHTLMAEALERWPVPLMQKVLPRHLQIIHEINRRLLEEVAARWPGDEGRLQRMSLIEEGGEQQVRMAHLAIAGSHSVNGVAELHSELIKRELVPDFHQLWPERFNNKTNGITQRRWLLQCNPLLSELITRAIGPGWIAELDDLRRLEARANDAAFLEELMRVKRRNKEALARQVRERAGVAVDPTTMFDVQIKRIHESKRQLLNVMHVIHLYLAIAEDGAPLGQPRTVLFAGKAAPGYATAKQIIHLINAVASTVNADRRVKDQLKVVFLPDYRVTLAEQLIPAADLSQQISTAGKEASGTGNMKLALNGALTLGTLDGANLEIRDEVGADNIFIFGATADELARLRPTYAPRAVYERDAAVRRVVDAIASNLFCPDEPGAFAPLVRRLLDEGDEYFHLGDFRAYMNAQQQVGRAFAQRALWARRVLRNIACMGRFSSDRTIREYARDIWRLTPAR